MYLKGFAQLGKMIHELLNGPPKKIEVVFDDSPVEHVLKLKWEVCETCNGKGTHVNPSIDAHGISSDEFDEDPDFRESYMSGAYDVPCYECKGRTTSLGIDRERTSKTALKAADEHFKNEESCRREREAERSMGA